MSKTKTLFDHLEGITYKKTKWSELSESDTKTFSVYMINRFLSMNPDLTEFVNDLQRYSLTVLSPKEVYSLYLDVLPKKKLFFKYIKASKEERYDSNLIQLISKHYECNKSESISALDIFFMTPEYKSELRSIISKYGYTEKEMDKLLK